ncbi:MAG TPA: hypothetical protein VI564_03370 [Candidatus Nanoarchaeia archaeon]|nr:hypothetical protein [Candidatus Nanoarchaeia archaeon]
MGLLNHLFGNRKTISREILIDNSRCRDLWEQHVKDFRTRETLVSYFNYKNIGQALSDLPALEAKLDEIKKLISKDLIDIESEEISEEEILTDLGIVYRYKIITLTDSIGEESQIQKHVMELLEKLYHFLRLELHIIALIKKKVNQDGYKANIRGLLLELFKLISQKEWHFYVPFKEEKFGMKAKYEAIRETVVAILLGQELEEEVESAEDRFVREAIGHMQEGSKHKFMKLAKQLYASLLKMSGAPFGSAKEADRGLKKLELHIHDVGLISQIISERSRKLTKDEIGWLAQAFIKAYDKGHLVVDLQSELGEDTWA